MYFLRGSDEHLYDATNFLTFSKTLQEAAYVDGCSNIRFFFKILLPTSTPVLTTVFISSFISTWNTYLWPMLVTNDPMMRRCR